ncbi:MAG: chemotaxis protein CheW [Casimicrobiaceae bacterium]
MAVPAESSAVLRFLTFTIDERVYALDASAVDEVIRVPAVARVPQSPRALLGVANLRGSILPVASLRELLGMADGSHATTSRAIVLNLGSPIALVVDMVSAVGQIPADRIETRQAKIGARPGESLTGAFQIGSDGPVAKILDVEALLKAAFAQRRSAVRPVNRMVAQPVATVPADAVPKAMLVTFEVAGQEFALDLEVVQEILPAPTALTAVARSEALVMGITSHRGALLPLLSLRGLLGFPLAPPDDAREKVVVMDLAGARVGLVADHARAILPAIASQIDALPEVLAARTGGESGIRAIYRADGGRRLISILAPDKLFREDVMERLNVERKETALAASSEKTADRAQLQFLVFRLGGDEFGLPIDSVDEVARVPERITRLPKTPKFLEGVINLRGDVLPVVDQRRRFDMPKAEDTQSRRLVVVRTERQRAGLIVDGVSDVLRVDVDSVTAAPELTDQIARLVRGVVNLESAGRIVLLLDPAELLTRSERGVLDAFTKSAEQASA